MLDLSSEHAPVYSYRRHTPAYSERHPTQTSLRDLPRLIDSVQSLSQEDVKKAPVLKSWPEDEVQDNEGAEYPFTPCVDMSMPLTLVIFGATGDLARKKLYPALYQLMFGAPDAPKIPQNAFIVGYGRSEMDLSVFLEKQCKNVTGHRREEFLKQCSYFAGSYDNEERFARLHDHLSMLEGGGAANRIFFLSVPPTVFADVAKGIATRARVPSSGWTRVILEKPFGRDSESFAELNSITASLFREDELFRIDHYLGKEVVLNLVALRFGNQFFEGLWNRNDIAQVQIIFKENLGTGGRGGYFDKFGIIRDIMQNHLLQVLLWLAMEPPSSLSAADIQKEKCKLLKAVRTLSLEDCFLGQFIGNTWTEGGQDRCEPGYLEDETVPAGSRCPTYAAVALSIDNDRWRGVPFLMRAGKGLDERLAEVRITFKEKSFNSLLPGSANELVMRIQPDEAIYLKFVNKRPGWEPGNTAPATLAMSYSKSFADGYVADAYERMFLNTAKGDRSLFVGRQELVEAWRIFTPLLHDIDAKKPQPVLYPFGVCFPEGMDAFAREQGIAMDFMSESLKTFREQAKSSELALKSDCQACLDSDGTVMIEPVLEARSNALVETTTQSNAPTLELVFDASGQTRQLILQRRPLGAEFGKSLLGPVKVRKVNPNSYASELGLQAGWVLKCIGSEDVSKKSLAYTQTVLKNGLMALPEMSKR